MEVAKTGVEIKKIGILSCPHHARIGFCHSKYQDKVVCTRLVLGGRGKKIMFTPQLYQMYDKGSTLIFMA